MEFPQPRTPSDQPSAALLPKFSSDLMQMALREEDPELPMSAEPISLGFGAGLIDSLRFPKSLPDPMRISLSDIPLRARHFNERDISSMKAQLEVERPPFQVEQFGRRFRIKDATSPYQADAHWLVASYPVFSPDSSVALITIGNYCPGLCGSGRCYLFERIDDNWEKSIVGAWWH